MKYLLGIYAALFLPGCSGIPILLTGSYSGTTDAGHEFRVGVQVPLGKSGKQVVNAQK